MSAPEGEGKLKASRRDHLNALARQGDAEAISELNSLPALPPLAAHLWVAFLELCATRQGGGFGPSPLSRLEIQAWERDEGVVLAPWERRAVLKLDSMWLAAQVAAADTKS